MSYDALIEAISENRPLVLVLGQAALSLETGTDPLLKDALKKIKREGGGALPSSYWDLLPEQEPIDDAFLEWLAARAERVLPPSWLEVVAGLPWNAVFTSSLDTITTKVFRNAWRRVEPVLSGDQVPHDPRHRSNLHVTYFFGRLANLEEDQRPPRSRAELRGRRIRHAVPLLNRLPETVTPLGLLIVEGFDPSSDWLSVEDLSGILQQFHVGQVLWFSWRGLDKLTDDAGLGDLIRRSIIIPYEEPLAPILERLATEGMIRLHAPPRGAAFEREITIGERVVSIPEEIWLSVVGSVSILDDPVLSRPKPVSEDRNYADFRRFLGAVDDASVLFDGVKRGFAFQREFELRLKKMVKESLDAVSRVRQPIILHGQSSTGKTVALARVAYDIRMEKQYPVLFSSRPGQLPTANEIDAFCQFMEQKGAKATVLVLDANLDIERYIHLSQALASRGRNVIVVGSSYAIEDGTSGESKRFSVDLLVDAPVVLGPDEINDLYEVVDHFAPGVLPAEGRGRSLKNGNHFLALLYRLIPETRYPISAGLGREVAVTEDELRRRGRKTTSARALGSLGEALREAGLEASTTLLSDAVDEIAGEAIDQAGQLIFYVMVPGRLGLRVPIDLLMRTIDRVGLENVITLFKGVDLFRWYEDDVGDLFVQPRLQLEARLICNRRLGGGEAEKDFAFRLLEKIKSTGSDWNAEIRFGLDLSRALGPNGPEGKRYARFYRNIADLLADLRNQRGIINSGLMLQEAMFRREYVRVFQDDTEVSSWAFDLLKKNVATLVEALKVAPESRGTQRHRGTLIVELAATYGFLAHQASKQGRSAEDVVNYYGKARDWAQRANRADPDNLYPVDVMLWSALDTLDDPRLSPETRAELHADIFDALERVDEESLDSEQFIRFHGKRQRAGLVLQDFALEQDAFLRLLSAGSKAGFLLRARQMVGDIPREESLDHDLLDRVKDARQFLTSNWEGIRDDARCLNYLLKLWWMEHTGRPLFQGERQPLPSTDEQRHAALEIVDSIILCDGHNASPKIRYLAATLNWSLRNYEAARNIWRFLAQDTDFSYSRRVRRLHLIVNRFGRPQRFEGQIQSVDTKGRRARVLVESLRQEIDLLPSDFGITEPRKGMAVPSFHIAFNFIGPIADARRFYEQ